MLETGRLARRDAALPVGADGPVRVLPACSRLSLRVKGVATPGDKAQDADRLPFPSWGGWPERSGGPGGGPAGDPSTLASGGTPPTPGPSPQGGGETSVLGLPLALPINRCAVSGERSLVRLGPDEWLVGGPEADTDAMAAEIAAALAGRFYSLVDVSHRSIAFEVWGPGAADILNAGCPLDLHARAFPPGSATRTLLGKAEIVLVREGDADVFRVECGRSFAAYVHAFLDEAALDVAPGRDTSCST